jgi:hypothetical protein
MSSTERINDLTELLNCVAQDLAEVLADQHGTANVRIHITAGLGDSNDCSRLNLLTK